MRFLLNLKIVELLSSDLSFNDISIPGGKGTGFTFTILSLKSRCMALTVVVPFDNTLIFEFTKNKIYSIII